MRSSSVPSARYANDRGRFWPNRETVTRTSNDFWAAQRAPRLRRVLDTRKMMWRKRRNRRSIRLRALNSNTRLDRCARPPSSNKPTINVFTERRRFFIARTENDVSWNNLRKYMNVPNTNIINWYSRTRAVETAEKKLKFRLARSATLYENVPGVAVFILRPHECLVKRLSCIIDNCWTHRSSSSFGLRSFDWFAAVLRASLSLLGALRPESFTMSWQSITADTRDNEVVVSRFLRSFVTV